MENHKISELDFHKKIISAFSRVGYRVFAEVWCKYKNKNLRCDLYIQATPETKLYPYFKNIVVEIKTEKDWGNFNRSIEQAARYVVSTNFEYGLPSPEIGLIATPNGIFNGRLSCDEFLRNKCCSKTAFFIINRFLWRRKLAYIVKNKFQYNNKNYYIS